MTSQESLDSAVLSSLPACELVARLKKACEELPPRHELSRYLIFGMGGFIRRRRRLPEYLEKFGKPSDPTDCNAADINYLLAVEAANRKG